MNAVEKIISDCHKAEERSAELADKLDSLESAFDELLFSDATDQNHPAAIRLCDTVNKLMGKDHEE